MARQVEGAPASLNVNFDICMASAMCKSTTMPPAINWSQELADLRQEMADPLVPLPRFAGTSTCHTPPDDQRRPAPHHALLALQTLPVRAKIEGQLARKTLLQWVLRYAVMSFIALPAALSRQVRYASHKATLAIRLWTLLTVLCASVAATSMRRGTCSPCPLWPWSGALSQLSEHQALDLSWHQLAKPQIWLWLLLDQIEAGAAPKSVMVVSSWRRFLRMARPLAMPHFPPAHFYTLAPSSRSSFCSTW